MLSEIDGVVEDDLMDFWSCGLLCRSDYRGHGRVDLGNLGFSVLNF